MARTREIENPYFVGGWDDWTFARASGDNLINTVDGVKYGLVTGLGNPLGFPTVGRSYMLLARQMEVLFGTSVGSNIVAIESDTVYAFSAGDVIAADIGFVLTRGVGCTLDNVYNYFAIYIDGDGTTKYGIDTAADGRFRGTICHRVGSDTDAAIVLSFRYNVVGHAGVAGRSTFVDWVSVDNFRVFSAVNFRELSDVTDTSGVT